MFKNILAILISNMFFVQLAYADYLSRECERIYRNNQPEVSVTYNYGQLKYDNSKTSEELRKIYKQVNSYKEAGNIQGLTYLAPNVTTMSELEAQMLDNNHTCFYPRKIKIKIWYEPTVFIVNSLKVGTCRFNTTVRHEQAHLDLGHQALYLFAKSLRDAAPEIVSVVSPIVSSSSADGEKVAREMTDAYHEKVKVYFEEFKQNLEKYNYMLDTPENYIQETKLCGTD